MYVADHLALGRTQRRRQQRSGCSRAYIRSRKSSRSVPRHSLEPGPRGRLRASQETLDRPGPTRQFAYRQ